jgi:fatty acid desaturase
MKKADSTLTITDPIYRPKERPDLFEREALAVIVDKRDLPFIKLMASITFTVIPFAAALYTFDALVWWLALPYLALTLGVFLGPFILMLHNTSHRPLFKMRYRWMRHYIPWVLGPFFGETPDTYYVHHIGMHHPENNLDDDLSCTMRYQRDRLGDFMRYFLRFFTSVVPDLGLYMWKRRRYKLLQKLLVGELTYYAIVTLLLWLDWRATLVVFIFPLLFTRFAMMTGNWAQHAFIDAADPENCYRNSITCINTGYNRRCFNDGYHIGHHLKPTRHWTEMPSDFEANRERYASEGAVVFEGLDYFMIWFLLMIKRYDVLARHYVDLRGDNPSQEEIVALLRKRTQRIGGNGPR